MAVIHDPLEKKSVEFMPLWQRVADTFGHKIKFGKIDVGLQPLLAEGF
jgi:hypothetical protein